MKVLIIKMSSMGDIIHTLPAISEAAQYVPDVQFDWVVEKHFSEIPAWHDKVNRVIPVELRRWRKHPLKALFSREWKNFRGALRQEKYDMVLDAQGLMKSALIAMQARGVCYGLDKHSAWEPIASVIYHKKIMVNPDQHAVKRIRDLFAKAFGYSLADAVPSFKMKTSADHTNELVFIHSASQQAKLWPEEYWKQLAAFAKDFKVVLPWGSAKEKLRAERIAANQEHVKVLPALSLTALAETLSRARAAVAVDTGLGHLAAALELPTVSLYGPTDPEQIGTQGKYQRHLVAKDKCFSNLRPEQVWQNLLQLLAQSV